MFKKKNSGMTVVHGDTLFFVSYADDVIQVDHTVLLGVLLEDEFASSSLPAVVRDQKYPLLVVPDFWIGQADLTLQSRKRSIVDPFVERKLVSEHPELPDIGLFFDYVFTMKPSENSNIYAFFLLEPMSYQLYQKLASLDLTPNDITIPAYIWGRKLEKMHPELAHSGSGLIQKLSFESYLYFYHKGEYLFSRSIQFADSGAGDTEALSALTYEINQSFYLFSQKKKAELEHIFIHSSRREDAAELAETLGREVHALDNDGAETEEADTLGPCGVFTPNDLAPSNQYMAIAQKDHARAREWRPVQMAGVIVGILLFLLLGMEYFFLVKWSKQGPDLANTPVMTGRSSREIIEQYNETLDLILEETRRPSSRKTMIDLARCLPENVRIKVMKFGMAENPNLVLTCIIRAEDMAGFRNSLSMLLKNLGNTFVRSPRLETRDIELGEISPGQGYTDYPIQFELRLG